MTQYFPGHCLPFSWCLALLIAIFSSGILNAQEESATKQKKTGTMVRVLCSQSLTGAEEEVILAIKTKDGEWKEHGKVMLRSPFITPWVHVPQGITHLLSKQGEELVSLGSFKSGKKLKRIVLVLLPDIATKSYQVNVINPSKLNFKKGKALIINYSKIPAVVKLGGEQKTVKPGQLLVENITANRDNMYRLLGDWMRDALNPKLR